MRTFPFAQVDAFTDRPLAGNPCIIVFDAYGLDDATMLAIAREMTLSETAFVRESRSADAAVRYFSPAGEIPLAGHPTIGTTLALVESDRVALTGDETTITLELASGTLPVDIETEDGKPQRIYLWQEKPVFGTTYRPDEVLPAFGLAAEDLLPGAPIELVSTGGTRQLLIPLKGHDALRHARLDLLRYVALRSQESFFTSHLFCLGGATAAGRTFARHLGAPPNMGEDPFTVSATGGMAAYLWRHGLIEQPRFVAEQGHWMGRPGEAKVEVVGTREAIETVRIGGRAVTVARGELCL